MGTIRVHEFMSLDGVIDAPLLRGSQRLPVPDQPIFARIPAHFVTHRSGSDYRPPSRLFAAAPAFPAPFRAARPAPRAPAFA